MRLLLDPASRLVFRSICNVSSTATLCEHVISLFQTFDQFEYDGCDNCDEFLRMKNNRDNVYDCTSSNFDGYVLFFMTGIRSFGLLSSEV